MLFLRGVDSGLWRVQVHLVQLTLRSRASCSAAAAETLGHQGGRIRQDRLGLCIAHLIACSVLPLQEHAYLQSLCCKGFPGRRRGRRVSRLNASGSDCRAAGPAAAVAGGRGGKVLWTRARPAVLQGCASSNAAVCATDALSWSSRSTRHQWLVRVLNEPSAAATCAALGEGEPGRDGSGVRALAACLLTGCTGPPLFLVKHPHACCNCRAF